MSLDSLPNPVQKEEDRLVSAFINIDKVYDKRGMYRPRGVYLLASFFTAIL